ncbi:SDR family NAD(P)-dependent oxidoreductase [Aurantimonas sp. VKM B-3413]|uniref:SDR family NAD(P)-dependent oxidoreductase n=1 Tax=Aurantimonas sp. VKM B-3413 TaxID=2779401 RepID=UPI001E3BD4FD|nr:SDR family oxidoreductase [Aurantimonas sp. VKM B-3413]MCB8837844.1 SDR family oxidoreductase [Aurantimonas sp. VKM B-3413]
MQGFDRELFAGRRIVVTGAGRGIGAAVARAFLACGGRVVAHAGRSLEHAEKDLLAGMAAAERERLTLLVEDLSDPGGGERLAEAVLAASGGLIDVLVNNAGTMGGRVAAEAIDAAQYDAVLDLNIRQVVALTSGLLPALKTGREPAIVNTSSISARIGGSPGSSLYSASKAFVSTWTRALARELAPDGIRVNAVSPGTIMTDFHRRYSTKEKLDATAASIPMKRLGTAEDCAPAYLFLASALLSGYITGQVIEVNGGQFMA